MWRAIHYVALGYPVEPSVEVRDAYATFFASLGPVLPCALCSKHYQEHLKTEPVNAALAGRDELFKWTIDLHNAVNLSARKATWTYAHAYQVYSDPRSSVDERAGASSSVTSSVSIKVGTLIASLILITAIMWWRRRGVVKIRVSR